LAIFAANCSCLHLLAALGCRTGRKGSFFAANFTSCHVIACICTYIHINFFSGMNHRVTILGCFGVLQRISGYSAYFSLNIYFQNRMSHRGTDAQSALSALADRARSLRQRTLQPLVTLGLPAYSRVFQLIPTYYFLQNQSHEWETSALRIHVWSSAFRRSEPRERGTPYCRDALRSSRLNTF
jgi:hypothetical protein